MQNVLMTPDGIVLTLERLDGEQLAALCTQASPPGSTLHVECEAGSFAIKVHSCKKLLDTDARFRIQGRPVNLSRRVRAELEVLLGSERLT